MGLISTFVLKWMFVSHLLTPSSDFQAALSQSYFLDAYPTLNTIPFEYSYPPSQQLPPDARSPEVAHVGQGVEYTLSPGNSDEESCPNPQNDLRQSSITSAAPPSPGGAPHPSSPLRWPLPPSPSSLWASGTVRFLSSMPPGLPRLQALEAYRASLANAFAAELDRRLTQEDAEYARCVERLSSSSSSSSSTRPVAGATPIPGHTMYKLESQSPSLSTPIRNSVTSHLPLLISLATGVGYTAPPSGTFFRPPTSTGPLPPIYDPLNPLGDLIVKVCVRPPRDASFPTPAEVDLPVSASFLLEAAIGRRNPHQFSPPEDGDKAHCIVRAQTLLHRLECAVLHVEGASDSCLLDDDRRSHRALSPSPFLRSANFVNEMATLSKRMQNLPKAGQGRRAALDHGLRDLNARVFNDLALAKSAAEGLRLAAVGISLPAVCPARVGARGGSSLLNVVVEECKLLASRERAPFSVICEVADGSSFVYEVAMPEAAASEQLVDPRSRGGYPSQFDPRSFPQHYAPPVQYPPFRQHDVENTVFSQHTSSPPPSFLSTAILPPGLQQQHSPYPRFSNPETADPLQTQPASSSISQPLIGSALLRRVFGPTFGDLTKRVKATSAFSSLPGWRLACFITKSGEDVRSEALVMQIIKKLHEVFENEVPENRRPFLKPYNIMCAGEDAGLIECLTDTKSIDEIKKATDNFTTLRDFFLRAYTADGSEENGGSALSFAQAQRNFLRSLAGYSLVCYILQVKDRHNANILLDRDGHIIHIDFGYVLGSSPKIARAVPLFSERAPMKLTGEYWDVLGGWYGLGPEFCRVLESGFLVASRHADEIAAAVELAILTTSADGGDAAKKRAREVADGVRKRLRPKETRAEQVKFIRNLVDLSLNDWSTSTYDWLQKNMNNYAI